MEIGLNRLIVRYFIRYKNFLLLTFILILFHSIFIKTVSCPGFARINIKAKPQNTYDAIIVGSGISGGWAAKELCEKGLKVLLLERGRNVQHPELSHCYQKPAGNFLIV